jgi:hypothetical protein
MGKIDVEDMLDDPEIPEVPELGLIYRNKVGLVFKPPPGTEWSCGCCCHFDVTRMKGVFGFCRAHEIELPVTAVVVRGTHAGIYAVAVEPAILELMIPGQCLKDCYELIIAGSDCFEQRGGEDGG